MLNNRNLWKNQLKNLTRKMHTEKKDKGNQFTVRVNTVTYTIMINRLIEMGGKRGLDIRREDIDLAGVNLQAQNLT